MSTPNSEISGEFLESPERHVLPRWRTHPVQIPAAREGSWRRHQKTGTAAAVPVVFADAVSGDHTFSLSFRTSFRLAITMPVSANRAMTLGSTMRLLNISVSSHTKSLPDTVPRKMNTSAITV